MSDEKKAITVRLEPETVQALKQYAKEHKTSQAAVIEKALKGLIHAERPATASELATLKDETNARIQIINDHIANQLEATKLEVIKAIQEQPIQIAELPAPESKEKRRLTMRERLTGYIENNQ